MFECMLDDPDREQLGHMLHCWHNRFENEPIMIRDALKRIGFDEEAFLDVIREIAGEKDGSINKTRLGWWLKRHEGRVVDGLRYPATADGLEQFIREALEPICMRMEKEARYQPAIKAQTLGEGLHPQRMEKLNRYEIHLDRKFEHTLAMLLKLKELRNRANPNPAE